MEIDHAYGCIRILSKDVRDRMNISYSNKIPTSSAYWKLFQTTGWNNTNKMSEDDVFAAIKNSWYIISAYDDNVLVGFGRIISDKIQYAFICDMIIEPKYQRKGIGSYILKNLIEYCQNSHIKVIWLFAASGKSRFYEKHGFVKRPLDAPGMQFLSEFDS